MLLLTRWLNLSTQRLWPITNEGGDRYSILADWSVLCGLLITREIKPHCRKCNYPFALCRFFSFSFQGKKEKKKPRLEASPFKVVYFLQCAAPCRLPNRCLLDLVGVDPTPAGCVDGWPTIGFFLFFLFPFFFNMQCELPIEEERGEERLRSG